MARGGPPTARCTVLVLHGEDGAHSLAGTIGHLCVDHQVIAPTHPDQALTQPPASAQVRALARTYLDLLAALGEDDVVVIGHSLGGWVAAQMAIDDTQGRISALVLIAPTGPHAPRRIAPRQVAVQPQGRILRPPPAITGPARQPGVPTLTLPTRLGKITVPALVVWGRQDRSAPPAYAHAWAGALGNGDLALIHGGGHLPAQRAPEATFAAIDTFLTTATPTP